VRKRGERDWANMVSYPVFYVISHVTEVILRQPAHWVNIDGRTGGMTLPYMKVRSRSNPEGNSVNLIIEAGNPHFPISEARVHTFFIQYPLGSLGGTG
jgi:hypothetical protein